MIRITRSDGPDVLTESIVIVTAGQTLYLSTDGGMIPASSVVSMVLV